VGGKGEGLPAGAVWASAKLASKHAESAAIRHLVFMENPFGVED
jgi:hypothetical protein